MFPYIDRMLNENELFGTVVPRRKTGSVKWDLKEMQGLLPMWVADMDFKAPPAVLEALHERVDHGIFGYSLADEGLPSLVVQRLKERYGYEIKEDWIVWLPGLETALTLASMSVGAAGDKTVCFSPIYPPFYTGPKKAERQALKIPFILEGGQWLVDWEALEQAFCSGGVSLLLFCNPHNPVGKVFERWELEKLAALCLEHGVKICSDEVHNDLILGDEKHISIASLSKEVADQTMTLMAPSKTFNIAGLGCGFAVIANDKWRQSFRLSMRSITPGVNPMGFVACQAAYEHGEEWRRALIAYLNKNCDLVEDFVRSHAPRLSMERPQATYLAWINASGLGVESPYRHVKSYRLGLSAGAPFGDEQYLRLNFACPRSVLEDGLARMDQAIKSL